MPLPPCTQARMNEESLKREEARLDAELAALEAVGDHLQVLSSIKAPGDFSVESTLQQAMAAAAELAPVYQNDRRDLFVAAENARTAGTRHFFINIHLLRTLKRKKEKMYM